MNDVGIAPTDYRLPGSTHVGRVRLQVSNLDRSLAYYEKVLGLGLLDRTDGGATLGVRGVRTTLLELREHKSAAPASRRSLLGLYHFAVLLPDRGSLGRFLVHLSALGAHPGMSDHLVSEAIYLSDPDGLGIEVYADRPRESWTLSEGQMVMATKPLDVDSVVEAGGNETWTGAPPGTKMGHVHFHVGDIGEAERFYHLGLGLDKIVWNYPGALFMSAGGYHHHVGVNTWAAGARPASDDDARLLDWELLLPDASSVAAAADSVERAGFVVQHDGEHVAATDPWGIRVRLVPAG